MNLLCANIEKSTEQDEDKHQFKHDGGSDKCCMESWGEKQCQNNNKDCENGRICQHLLLNGCMIMIPANMY